MNTFFERHPKLFKTIKGALIAFTGAGVAALFQFMSQLEYNYVINGQEVDLTLAVGALLSVLVNAIRQAAPGFLPKRK